MNTKLLSRSVIAASTLALTLFSALYAAPASAYGRGGGHYYGHGHGHFGVGLGVGVGVGLGLSLLPGYYHRSYYYPPVYYDYPYYPNEVIVRTVPAPRTVYIEQSGSYDADTPSYPSSSAPTSVVPSTGGNIWYYCHNPDGFYPSIKSCPGGWQKVPASPPPSEK